MTSTKGHRRTTRTAGPCRRPTSDYQSGPGPGNFSIAAGEELSELILTSYVWLYEAAGATEVAAVPGGSVQRGRAPRTQLGWPISSNGTANGTGVATETAAACVALCEKDDASCAAMTWKSSTCTDLGVGPCGGADDACCYLLAASSRLDNSTGWCTIRGPRLKRLSLNYRTVERLLDIQVM
jgi:hypothetical protein